MTEDWEVSFLESAVESLMDLSKSDQRRVARDVTKLKRAPLAVGEALGKQRDLDLSGLRRLRVGNFRVVYEVDSQLRRVEILAIDVREGSQVYAVAAQAMHQRRLRRIS